MSFKVDDLVWTKSARGWFQVVEVDPIQRCANLKLLSNSSDETLYKEGLHKNVGFDSMTLLTREYVFSYIQQRRDDLDALEDAMLFVFNQQAMREVREKNSGDSIIIG